MRNKVQDLHQVLMWNRVRREWIVGGLYNYDGTTKVVDLKNKGGLGNFLKQELRIKDSSGTMIVISLK